MHFTPDTMQTVSVCTNGYAANSSSMFRALIRKLTGADSAIDAIVERGPHGVSRDDHNRVYQAGCDLISPYMPLHNHESRSARSSRAQQEMERGIQLLTFITHANPANWNAHWIIGKGYQALGNSAAACDSFRASFDLQKDNPDVAREYMFECLNLGRGKDGVEAARHAVSLEPHNPGLLANLALALLIAADLDAAEKAANQALAADPKDAITKDLARMIRDVKSGRKSQPNRIADLQ
jgi:tetratricopeptide (TPR) repeat protein